MAEITPKRANENPWVKLHLEPQSAERSTMPPWIVGILLKDNPTTYILTNIIESEDGVDFFEREGLTAIHKTYVWRCDFLPSRPDLSASEDEEAHYERGGLG